MPCARNCSASAATKAFGSAMRRASPTDARRIAEPKAFVAALAEQFLAHGIDVSRLVTGVPILHPQVYSFSARWDLGQGSSGRFFHLTAETLPVLENSPVKTIYTG